MRKEVRFSGFGGQGIIMASVVLGAAATLYDCKNAVQTQSYGPEARGGASCAEVVIADEEINYPQIRNADYLVALSQMAFDKFSKLVHDNGIVLVDCDMVSVDDSFVQEASRRGISVYVIPFMKSAEELGNLIVANSITLGALSELTGVVSMDALKKALSDIIPQKVIGINYSALEEGVKLGKEARKAG